ncbi:MAG TPA: 4'-phosphopantetheinyl transferase superfamily protein [Vicinamibacterales bacterium]|jgi:4'-phosphopantetheinyl transferase
MPRADEVRAEYLLTDTLEPSAIAAAAAILSDSEKARAASFLRPQHRRDYIAAHALLRQALSRRFPLPAREWSFEVRPGGKPALAAPFAQTAGLSFNLAHTGGLVACIVADGVEAGIDVESVDRAGDSLAIARRYFASNEHARLEKCAPEARARRFVELWTLKEAVLKATGAGITASLDGFSFETDDSLAIRFDAPAGERAADWQFGLFAPSSSYRLAVAIRRPAQDARAITAAAVKLETAY